MKSMSAEINVNLRPAHTHNARMCTHCALLLADSVSTHFAGHLLPSESTFRFSVRPYVLRVARYRAQFTIRSRTLARNVICGQCSSVYIIVNGVYTKYIELIFVKPVEAMIIVWRKQ